MKDISTQTLKDELLMKHIKIPFQKRKQLIRLVQEQNVSIKKASKIVKVKYSTGKLIIRKYKKQGKITIFSYQKTVLENHQHPQQCFISENRKEGSVSNTQYKSGHEQSESFGNEGTANQIVNFQNIPSVLFFGMSPITNLNYQLLYTANLI